MSWNHRVLATVDPNGNVYLRIHEVYESMEGDNLIPRFIGGCSIKEESIEEIAEVLDQMQKCLKKPILWGGYRFPQEYKPTEKQNPNA